MAITYLGVVDAVTEPDPNWHLPDDAKSQFESSMETWRAQIVEREKELEEALNAEGSTGF